jgi:hypothetical protein
MFPHDLLTKCLVPRQVELERVRTRALATQQWHKVIATEAQIKEVESIRRWIANHSDGPGVAGTQLAGVLS